MQYLNRQYPLTQTEKKQRAEEQAKQERQQRLSNNRLGVTVFQVSWIMAFIALIVVYWQLGFTEGWRPTADLAPIPSLLLTGAVHHHLVREKLRTQVGLLIDSADGQGRRWSTVGVSANIVDASFEALLDAVRWKLLRDSKPKH